MQTLTKAKACGRSPNRAVQEWP